MNSMSNGAPTIKFGEHSAARGKVGAVRKPYDEEEKSSGRAMLAALEVFRMLRQTMPLQYVVTFLLVALDEGKSVAEYARKQGVSASVMSRHLLDIGERNRHMQAGFGLVTYRKNPENERENQYFLTPRGCQLYQQIKRRLEDWKHAGKPA